METPIRVHRKRTKGSKLPENTVCVTRGTKWGNPYVAGEVFDKFGEPIFVEHRLEAVQLYEQYLNHLFVADPKEKEILIEQLKGKNLACFCPLDKPCHADTLLKIANELF